MEHIKIIALDMDGVVNSRAHVNAWIKEHFSSAADETAPDYAEARKEAIKAFREEFNHAKELVFPDLAERVTRICRETGAKILWSSTWRRLTEYSDIADAKAMFTRRGLPADSIVGYTPNLGADYGYTARGEEIALWLKNNNQGNVVKCAVLDDRADAGTYLPDCAKFFQTSMEDGLTEEITQAVIEYLNS